jgi:hypothetical protein
MALDTLHKGKKIKGFWLICMVFFYFFFGHWITIWLCAVFLFYFWALDNNMALGSFL